MALNKVLLIGNLGRDAESRFTTSGQQVVNFTLATGDSYKDKTTGEAKKTTEWHRCVCWGKQAEIADKYLKKGMQIFVEGQIQYREYEKDGVKRSATDIKVLNFRMLDKKENTAGGSFESQTETTEDSDVPF